MAQIIGLVLLAVGGWLLWSPWALVLGGLLLLIGPELLAAARRSNLTERVPTPWAEQARREGR